MISQVVSQDKIRQQVIIPMPYISNLSVNHYKYAGGRFTKPEIKAWMSTLMNSIQAETMFKDLSGFKLSVDIQGKFQNKRVCPDLHNLEKVILDSVEKATAINDKFIAVSCGVPEIEKRIVGGYGLFNYPYKGGTDWQFSKGELIITMNWSK